MADSVDLRTYCGPSGVFLAWWHATKVADCLGYAVLRRVNRSAVDSLLAYVGFADDRSPVQANQEGQPSTVWPYQRFTWTDFHPPADSIVEYRVVAMVGTPDAPRQSGLLSAWVEGRKPVFTNIVPYFNFGIVGSRWFSSMAAEYPEQFEELRKALVPAHKVSQGVRKGARNKAEMPPVETADKALDAVLKLPVKQGEQTTIGNALGGQLAAKMAAMLTETLENEDAEIYASLFELSEPQLIGQLKALGSRCHLILANGTHQHHDDENKAAAGELSGAVDLSRRMIERSSVYAHNKFVVFTEKGDPRRVWTGSTNWSPPWRLHAGKQRHHDRRHGCRQGLPRGMAPA